MLEQRRKPVDVEHLKRDQQLGGVSAASAPQRMTRFGGVLDFKPWLLAMPSTDLEQRSGMVSSLKGLIRNGSRAAGCWSHEW